MKNMTLKEIAVACGGIYYGDDESYYKEVPGCFQYVIFFSKHRCDHFFGAGLSHTSGDTYDFQIKAFPIVLGNILQCLFTGGDQTVCLSPFAVQEWMDTCSSRRRSGTALCVRSPKNGLKMPLIHTFWSPPVNRH